jgi:hypothetical protein
MRDMERGGIEVVGLIAGAREPEESVQIIDFKTSRKARTGE